MSFIRRHWRFLPCGFIAFVFIQALFFKFSGSAETRYIFSTLGEWMGLPVFAEYGAYVIGAAELVAALLLFSPWIKYGAVLSFLIMCGAIFFHLFTPLGVEMPSFDKHGQVVGDDGGLLFALACLTALCALVLLVAEWCSNPTCSAGANDA